MLIEEEYLTYNQAIELKELGIDFKDSNFCITLEGEIFKKSKAFILNTDKLIDTLSIAEMLVLCPKHIYTNKATYEIFYTGSSLGYHNCKISEHSDIMVVVLERGICINAYTISILNWNLRDALFEILKWLKKSNLI